MGAGCCSNSSNEHLCWESKTLKSKSAWRTEESIEGQHMHLWLKTSVYLEALLFSKTDTLHGYNCSARCGRSSQSVMHSLWRSLPFFCLFWLFEQ